MKAVIAIDSFKGSMTSLEAGGACAEGILRALPDADVVVRPMADGGEGTVDALVYATGAQFVTSRVTGPFGIPVDCRWGLAAKTKTAILEMSGAAGITLVPRDQLDPRAATTYGVGEVIREAVEKGCRTIYIGIGGSATNDGGVGMLSALGFRFLDQNGRDIPAGAAGLEKLTAIDISGAMPELKECTFRTICDVNNPLTGERGASAVFGPQKGATPDMVRALDAWLTRFAELTKEIFPDADPDLPGSGAAGGMGFGLRSYLGASLEPGIDIVLEVTDLDSYLKDADIAVTGEGRIDRQTVMGKAPAGVAGLARKYGIPVVAFAGGVTDDARYCNDHGIDAFFPIVRGVTTLDEAMDPETAKANMADASEQVFRLLARCGK